MSIRPRMWWQRVRDSLWFVPGLMTIGAAILAIALVRLDVRYLGSELAADAWWLFGGSPQGATSVLQSISGSIITGTAFPAEGRFPNPKMRFIESVDGMSIDERKAIWDFTNFTTLSPEERLHLGRAGERGEDQLQGLFQVVAVLHEPAARFVRELDRYIAVAQLKLELRDRAQLVVLAYELGVVRPGVG